MMNPYFCASLHELAGHLWGKHDVDYLMYLAGSSLFPVVTTEILSIYIK